MKRTLIKIYSSYALLLFATLLIPALVFYLIIKATVPYKQQIRWVYKVNFVVMRIWSPLVGFRYRCTNRGTIDKNETYIIIMNHLNIIDMFVVNRTYVIPAKPLIKKELLRVPILGWLFGLTSLPIDRSSKESKQNGFKKMLQELNQGISILIFPEGTRNGSKNILESFKDGAFKLAIKSNIKILPAVILNTKNKSNSKSLLFKPGLMELQYLNPIDPSNFNGNYVDLKKYCFNIMEQTIVDYNS